MSFGLPAFAALVMIAPGGVFAQTPIIDYVETQTGPVSPGDRATVFCRNLSILTATVQVGDKPAPVFSREPWIDDNDRTIGDVLHIQIPVELAPGPATLIVTANGASSAPFSLTLKRYSPVFDGRDLERAKPGGGFAPYTCAPGETPQPGDTVRVYVTGLGPTAPAITTGAPGPSSPLAQTVVKPAVFFGSAEATVMESVLAPGEIGVYRVTFKVPPGTGTQLLALSIGGELAIGPNVPIGNGLNFYLVGPAAPGSFAEVAPCGGSLTSAVPQGASQIVAVGDPRNPPTTLAGTTVRIRDSTSVELAAPLLYVSPIQANFIIPTGTASGTATVTATTGDGVVSLGTLKVEPVGVRLLWDNLGHVPLGYLVRVRNGVQTLEPFVNDKLQRVPIDLGPETDEVYLVLYGTGWRNRASLDSVKVYIFAGYYTCPVQYAGPQSEFAGLDQLNVLLPRSLAMLHGDLPLVFHVDGSLDDFVTLLFK